jgi:GWxTD domain-containing protein
MTPLLAALSLFATLSSALQEWPRGPVQWIMTKDEQRAWSQVRNDQEANDFIDLFWARRDPSPGTERNEFRDQFEQRVRAVDRSFSAGKKRGALTDMGRIWIVLGQPKESSSVTAGVAGSNPNGGQGQGFTPDASRSADDRATFGPASNLGVVARASARNSFTYDNWLPLGLSKPEIVFIEDGYTHEFKVDPQQANPYGALAKQASLAIVNPGLTAVPDWAMKGGLEPKRPAAAAATTIVKPASKTETIAGEPGATRLTLLKNVNALQLQGPKDPFIGVASEQRFARTEELGYAFQLCRKAASEDPVKVTLRVVGPDGAMAAPTEELQPDSIRVMPACYAIRGAVPLTAFTAGHYRLELQVEDGGQTYELAQELEVQ